MADASYLQTSFAGGEWSQFSRARLDKPAHRTALQVCVNGLPLEEGVWTRRPGFQWLGETQGNQSGRVRSISFSGVAPAVMELTAGHLRVRFGAQLANEFEEIGVSISTASPAVLTVVTPGATWATGTPVRIVPTNAAAIQGMAYCANRVFLLTQLTSNTFSLTHDATGNPADGTKINWQAGMTFQVWDVWDLTTPYLAADLPLLRFVQAEFQVLLLHPNYPPYMLLITPTVGQQVNGFIPTFNNLQYAFFAAQFVDGPYLNLSTTQELVALDKGSGTVTMSVTSIADLNNGLGFLSTDVGRMIRMHSEPPSWSPTTNYGNNQATGGNGGGSTSGTYTFSNGVYSGNGAVNIFGQALASGTVATPPNSSGNAVSYPGPDGANLYYICTGMVLSTTTFDQIIAGPVVGLEPDTNPISWSPTLQAHTWTWGTISQVLGSSQVKVKIYGPNIMYPGIPMSYAMGSWSATTGYPANGAYHQGRFFLAGAQPNRFDTSVSNNQFVASYLPVLPKFFSATQTQICMAPTDNGGTIQLAGQVLDSSALSETLNAADINQIVWMEPNAQGLVIGTASTEYLMQAPNNNNVLTPTSIVVNPVTHYGCANVEPRHTGLTTVFVQRFGRKLLEYLADVFSGRFYGPNLTEMTRHMTTPGIAELAFQEEKTPIVWMRLTGPVTIAGIASSLVGATYRRISMFLKEPPEFNGWHRHAHGFGNLFTSMTSGPSPDGLLETITCVTQDTNGNNNVELMSQIFEEDQSLTQAWFLDGAIAPPAAATSVSAGFATGGITLLGMTHFGVLGQSVTVFLGGLNCGQFTVPPNQDQLFVPWGSDPDKLLTYTYLQTLSNPTAYGKQAMPVDLGALTVSCVVGYPYVSQGQLIRPLEPPPGTNGPLLGKTRRTHMIGALLQNAITNTIQFGTNLLTAGTSNGTLRFARFISPGNVPYKGNQMFDDVYWNTIESNYDFDNGVAWQVTGPYPMTLVAMEGFYKVEDR